jgi:hypothetical protein
MASEFRCTAIEKPRQILPSSGFLSESQVPGNLVGRLGNLGRALTRTPATFAGDEALRTHPKPCLSHDMDRPNDGHLGRETTSLSWWNAMCCPRSQLASDTEPVHHRACGQPEVLKDYPLSSRQSPATKEQLAEENGGLGLPNLATLAAVPRGEEGEEATARLRTCMKEPLQIGGVRQTFGARTRPCRLKGSRSIVYART